MAKPTTPSLETGMLSFARSLQVSEGLFSAVDREGRKTPVAVIEKGVRGQSSEDLAKNPGQSNPQTVEHAVIPPGYEAVELSFSLRVIPRSRVPHACDAPVVRETYVALADAYAEAGGYEVLATLYAWNIANSRFAWRNRFQSDTQHVTVEFDAGRVVFDPLMLSLQDPATPDALEAAMIDGDRGDLDALIASIARGLSEGPFYCEVTWWAGMAEGAEVFPSQEYLRAEKVQKGLSRVLAKLPTFVGDRRIMQASMHSQKIGAALRTIDVWHRNPDFGPVPVNPYAGDQESGQVLRDAKNSFYGLRRDHAGLIEAGRSAATPAEIPDQLHFVMANLVRGGVFGKRSKKEAEAAAGEAA